MLHPVPDKAVKVVQLVWDMSETALDLGDDADSYRLFDTAHALVAVYLYIRQIILKNNYIISSLTETTSKTQGSSSERC